MTNIVAHIFLIIIELIILIRLGRNRSVFSPVIIGIAIPFFYSHALLFDYFLFSVDELHMYIMGSFIHVKSNEYLAISLLYFVYIIGFSIPALLKKKENSEKINPLNPPRFQLIFYVIAVSILFYYTLIAYGAERIALKASSGPLKTLSLGASFYYVTFFVINRIKWDLTKIITIVILVLFSLFGWEREWVLFSLIAVCLSSIKISNLKIGARSIMIGAIALTFMLLYKWLYSYLRLEFMGEEDLLYKLPTLTLAGSDPLPSMLMIKEYLNDDPYDMYYGSYITNIIMQVVRMFGLSDWQSIGEFTMLYYTNDALGLGFSMILESMINFGIIGPVLIGIMIGGIASRLEYLRGYKEKIAQFVFFIFALKLVRSELAVVLKLYMLPCMITYFFYRFSFKKA